MCRHITLNLRFHFFVHKIIKKRVIWPFFYGLGSPIFCSQNVCRHQKKVENHWCREWSGLPFGLFWNSFLEIKWFGHLAFSWPFFNSKENSIFLGLFRLNFNKNTTFYSISKFIWYILVNFRWKFGLFWPFLAFFGLFHNIRIWLFLKRLMAKFGLF